MWVGWGTLLLRCGGRDCRILIFSHAVRAPLVVIELELQYCNLGPAYCRPHIHTLMHMDIARLIKSGYRISHELDSCLTTLLSTPFLIPCSLDISTQQCSISDSSSTTTKPLFKRWRSAWMSKWNISPQADALHLRRPTTNSQWHGMI